MLSVGLTFAGGLGDPPQVVGTRVRRGVLATASLIVVGGLVVAATSLPQYPSHQTAPLVNAAEQLETALAVARPDLTEENRLALQRETLALKKDLVQLEVDNRIKIWTGLVQAVGAIVIAIGGYFTWRNLRVAQENLEEAKRKAAADREASEANLKAAHERLDSDREAQITNRFTQAISQLGAELKDGDPNVEVRLGGIYALERIARDSPRDHWPIMEVLTAYVRKNAPANDRVPAVDHPTIDIQTILDVLGRRNRRNDRYDVEPEVVRELNLARTDLHGARLRRAHFEDASLHRTRLERAVLRYAHLEGANLWEADLEDADLTDAHLDDAKNLGTANLARADLKQAHLTGTDLTEQQVRSAYRFEGATLPDHLASLQQQAVGAAVASSRADGATAAPAAPG